MLARLEPTLVESLDIGYNTISLFTIVKSFIVQAVDLNIGNRALTKSAFLQPVVYKTGVLNRQPSFVRLGLARANKVALRTHR
jgi:hypothetical protein